MKIKVKLNGCNLDCIYCPEENRGRGENNPEKIKKFITASYDNGLNELQWSGGEPTIHKELLPLIEFANKVGFYQSLTTNGTCRPEYLKELKDVGLSRVNISLDTLDTSKFKKITGKYLLDHVLNNIEVASNLFNETIKINTVVSDLNIDEISNIYNRFKNNNKIITRFLQMTYKGDDNFVDKHRIDTSQIGLNLPVSCFSEIELKGRIFTNPVAVYYKDEESNNVFSIVPQDHSCKGMHCNKIWCIGGRVFICKINPDKKEIDSNMSKTIKSLIAQKCSMKTNPNGHRIR